MMNEAFVFFDIDGTIYDYVNGVSKSAKEAIRLLKENGHHPVLCTGRTRVMIFPEIIDMGFDGIIGGAGTYVEWKGELLKETELSMDQVRKLVTTLAANGFASYPEGQKYFYFDPDYIGNGYDEMYRVYQVHIPGFVHPIDLNSEMHVSKVSAGYTPNSNRDAVIAELGDDYMWVDHNGALFETIPKGTSKGIAIKELMEYLGRGLEDTYAYGDSFNDLEMLQTVQYGVLMGNSKDSLKKMVPLHTETMLDDGVYKSLKRFGLI